MKIDENQIELLELIKKYHKKLVSNGIDVAESSLCWLLNVPGLPSYSILKKIQKNKQIGLSGIYSIIKHFISLSTLHNYKLINKSINSKKSFERLIISFAKKSDFKADGSYEDRYFSVNSRKDLKTLWFLLYVDDSIPMPKNVDKNILVFGKENVKKKYNVFYLINFFYKIIKTHKGSLTKIFHSSSRASHLAKILSEEVIKIVKLINFKTILIAYEAQPFQNTVFKKIRTINDKIKLIGYYHSTQPLPTFFICRDGYPDILLVHGSTQIYHLNKYFNWPAEKLRLIPSLRYKKKDKKFFVNNLVIPIGISSKKVLLRQFEKFLMKTDLESLKPFTIKKHPFSTNPKIQKKFVNNIEMLLLRYKNRFSPEAKRDIAIFFGGTSAILEALESGLSVIHICGDVILESYSETLWPSIKVSQINKNMFEYSLRSYGKCINLSLEDNLFEKYCNL